MRQDAKHRSLCSKGKDGVAGGLVVSLREEGASKRFVDTSEIEVRYDRPLGAGATAKVYAARCRGREVACKIARKVAGIEKGLLAEIALGLSVNHPHVLGILWVAEDEENVFILSQLADGGTLAGMIYYNQIT